MEVLNPLTKKKVSLHLITFDKEKNLNFKEITICFRNQEKYRTDIEDKIHEIDSLRHRNKELNNEIDRLTETNGELSREFEYNKRLKNEDKVKYERKIDSLKSNLTKKELEFKETADRLNNHLREVNEENDKIKKDIHDMFIQMKDNGAEQLQTIQEHSELKSELEKLKKENEILDQQKEKITENIQIYINKMNTLTLEHLKEKEHISLVFINYTMKLKD